MDTDTLGRDAPIPIIGGGIGGLAIALALADRGRKTIVFEQAAELGEIGAGLTIGANAAHCLDSIGMMPVLQEWGVTPGPGGVRHWRTGEFLVPQKQPGGVSEDGYRMSMIHRADLHRGMVDRLMASGMGAVRTNHRVESADTDGDSVTARFANGETITAPLLIAAEGARSPIRQALFDPAPPHFSGQVAWRAMIPVDELPAEATDPDSGIFVGVDKLFMRYMVRKRTLMNMVASCRSNDDWAEEGWNIKSTVAELRGRYEGWHKHVQMLIDRIPEEKCYKWAIFERAPLDRWVEGRAVLLGDAAHAMQPFLAQGASMALEDALILARCLTEIADLDTALGRYQAIRMPRATAVQAESRRQGARYQSNDPDNYTAEKHRGADPIGLFAYRAGQVPLMEQEAAA